MKASRNRGVIHLGNQIRHFIRKKKEVSEQMILYSFQKSKLWQAERRRPYLYWAPLYEETGFETQSDGMEAFGNPQNKGREPMIAMAIECVNM